MQLLRKRGPAPSEPTGPLRQIPAASPPTRCVDYRTAPSGELIADRHTLATERFPKKRSEPETPGFLNTGLQVRLRELQSSIS